MEEPLTHQLGHDGFVWFIGVVESLTDPLYIGRAKVRIFGWHNPDVTVLATDALPWAVPLHPITHATLTPNFRVGDWIVGFFLDGKLGQQPMMAWVLPGVPQTAAPAASGFVQVQYRANAGPLVPNPDAIQFRFQTITLTDETADPSVTANFNWQPDAVVTTDPAPVIVSALEQVNPGSAFTVGKETFKALQAGFKSDSQTVTHSQFSDHFSAMVTQGLTGQMSLSPTETGQLAVVLADQAKRDSLKTPTLIFSMAAASDWASTAYALGTLGAHEQNPAIAWLKNPKAIIAAGAGLDVLGIWAWTKFVGGNHPKLATVGLYVATAFRIGLAVRNFTETKAKPGPVFLPGGPTIVLR